MFLDQLLILSFFILLLILRTNILFFFKTSSLFFIKNNLTVLLNQMSYFYIIYILNYVSYIFTFTKWISSNYSDAYWALYSSKLSNNFHNIYFKK